MLTDTFVTIAGLLWLGMLFAAALWHDLAQPLNAAHLFTHALAQRLQHECYREEVNNIDHALSSAEGLLFGLLDISQLDAGGMTPKIQVFCMRELLQHLATKFRVIAHDKGLILRCVASQAWVRSDPQLLRRVLRLDLIARIGPCPCVIITADQSEALRDAVSDAGCQLLYKPLKPLALKSVMARLVASMCTWVTASRSFGGTYCSQANTARRPVCNSAKSARLVK